jgi:hypothetical protein
MKRAKRTPSRTKPRNPVARSPLLGKGGPHEKSPSARRQRAKAALARELRDDRDE